MSAIEKLAKMPCKTCGGSTTINVSTEEGEGLEWIPCPDCQEDGKPTGLAVPWLTRPCYCNCHAGVSLEEDKEYPGLILRPPCCDPNVCCEWCSGTGGVPRSPPEQLWTLVEWAHRHRPYTLYRTFRAWCNFMHTSAELLEALAAAVLACRD